MHRTDALRLAVVDDPVALDARNRARARGEAAEALVAVVTLAIAVGALAGWRLPF